VDQLYKDRKAWARKSILCTAGMGKFSSDRTVAEYARDIWHIQVRFHAAGGRLRSAVLTVDSAVGWRQRPRAQPCRMESTNTKDAADAVGKK